MERPNPDQEPLHILAGLRKVVRNILGRPDDPAVTEAITHVAPENTNHDVHRNEIASQMRTLFDTVDARVGGWIGYSGNIREELKGRVADRKSLDYVFDIQDLDPSLQSYMHANIFSFRLHNEDNGMSIMYMVNCQRGLFTPSVHVGMPDGFVETTLYLGPERDKFEHVKFRRVFNDGRVRQVSTFASNYMDSYSPPHPLIVEQGWLPMPKTHAIYDGIDEHGNVFLLDRQTISDQSGGYTGRYSSADHSMSPVWGGSFPYSKEENCLLIGRPGSRQVAVPFRTNIYEELNDITAAVRALEL